MRSAKRRSTTKTARDALGGASATPEVRQRKALAAFAGLVATTWCCSGAAASGHIKVLTYNIAGLPDGFMTAHPSVNMSLIGSLRSRYDLALIQEDFARRTLREVPLTAADEGL